MPPLFITFEGLDGSGKSTQLRGVVEALERAGEPPVVTCEPGGTEIGEGIRAVFLDQKHRALDGVVELLLVFASRRQNLLEVIEPALRAGRVVLCDRFTDSTRVYQGAGRGLGLEQIDRVDELATGRRVPDRTILLDLPAEEARHRRASGSSKSSDRIDSETLAFYERVRRAYLDLAAAEPERFRVVDATGDKAATQCAVRRELADLLPALAEDAEAAPSPEAAS